MSNLKDLSVAQLRKIIEIREEIEILEGRLAALGGESVARAVTAVKARGGKRTMSAAGRARIAAAARKRWAAFRKGNPAPAAAAPKAAKAGKAKRRFSAAVRAKMAATARARWAKAKAAGKSTL